MSAWVRRLSLLLIVLGIFPLWLPAQQQAYLLMQGPRKSNTYRFAVGETVEWRLKGEPERFSAKIQAVYPESQAIRLDDLLLRLDQIAEMRYLRRGRGWRGYLRAQGAFNLVVVGGAVAFSRQVRREQQGFALGAAIVSAGMVAAGNIDRYHRPRFQAGGKFVLKIAGGDLRESDDPNRG